MVRNYKSIFHKFDGIPKEKKKDKKKYKKICLDAIKWIGKQTDDKYDIINDPTKSNSAGQTSWVLGFQENRNYIGVKEMKIKVLIFHLQGF